jgi:hypothetical protein
MLLCTADQAVSSEAVVRPLVQKRSGRCSSSRHYYWASLLGLLSPLFGLCLPLLTYQILNTSLSMVRFSSLPQLIMDQW